MPLDGSCPTLYGPVESRRHGRSLGINLGSPDRKICSWACLYCQCGKGERREITASDGVPSKSEVLEALSLTLRKCGPLDSVTLAGNSEPATHPDFLEIVRGVVKLKHAMRARWIFNCLTNGSELDRPEVVRACDLLDEAWVKFDCGTDDQFRRLNHPLSKVGSVKDHIARIRRLKRPRIQTLFWTSASHPEACNWNAANREALLAAYQEIQPAEIHLTTVAREPAWSGALPVPEAELESFKEVLVSRGFKCEVFA